MRLPALTGALWLILCVTSLAAQQSFPAGARQHLDSVYPGWRFATLRADLARNLLRGASPAWVSGDFDGDGQPDYAVQILPAVSSPDSAQRVLFLLRRRSGYAEVLIQAGALADYVYLLRERAGSKAVDLEVRDDTPGADAESGTFILPHDAVTMLYAEQAASTCFLVRQTLRCVVTGD
jgi:hypothetical protein